MSDWKETTLGEVIELQRGFDLTEKQSETGPYPVISSGGVNYHTSTPKVQGPGVVTGRKGVLGKVHFSAGPYWPHDTTLWVKDFKGNDPLFIYYWLQTVPLAALDVGAANPTLNRNHAHLLKVRVPNSVRQIRIAAILSGIDDLIGNNRRRIALLEQMAQAIYREWFVHFRYPGHDDDELVDSRLGPIPTGWELTTVGQSFSTVLGGTPSRRNPAFWNGEVPWLNSGKTNELRVIEPSEYITALGLARSSTKLMPPKTTLVAITGATLGQVSMLEAEMCANQSVVGVYDESGLHGEWTYRTFVDRIDGIVQSASGGAQQHINKGVVENVVIARPSLRVLAEFNRAAEPLGDEIATLLRSNRGLEAIRDILLPKLVTGAIDLSKVDLDALLEESQYEP